MATELLSRRDVSLDDATSGSILAADGATTWQAEPESAVVQLLHKAGEALRNDRNEAHRYIEKAAALLRGKHNLLVGHDRASPKPARCRLAPWQVTRVTQFVDSNLGEKIAIQDFADMAGLSASHFSRAFRSTVGESPHAYVIRRRIERAQEMIRATNKPLSQIALDCGLSDQAHLTKLFRRVVGASPGVWRRMQNVARRDIAA